jgi:voltage-gated sodium channel
MINHASHQRSSVLDRAVLVAILANTAILGWGLLDRDHEDLIGALDEVVLWFFALEIAIRFKIAGRRCFRDRWLLVDAVIVVVALAPVGADVLLLRVVRACRIAHFGRHLPHLRHVLSLRLLTGRRADTVPTP